MCDGCYCNRLSREPGDPYLLNQLFRDFFFKLNTMVSLLAITFCGKNSYFKNMVFTLTHESLFIWTNNYFYISKLRCFNMLSTRWHNIQELFGVLSDNCKCSKESWDQHVWESLCRSRAPHRLCWSGILITIEGTKAGYITQWSCADLACLRWVWFSFSTTG